MNTFFSRCCKFSECCEVRGKSTVGLWSDVYFWEGRSQAVLLICSTSNWLHVVIEKVDLLRWATTMGLSEVKCNNFFFLWWWKKVLYFMFMNFMLLKFGTFQSKVISVSLENVDFSHLCIHTTGLGELGKQFRRDLKEWSRVEAWTLGIKAVLINIAYQEKCQSLFWLFEKSYWWWRDTFLYCRALAVQNMIKLNS